MNKNSVAIKKVYQGNRLRLYTAASLTGGSDLADWVTAVDKNTHILFFDQNFAAAKTVDYYRDVFSGVDKSRFTFLSSTVCAHETRLRAGVESWLISNNILVNENVFYDDGAEKQFTGLLVARDIAIKRIHLASEVSNLALVIDRWHNSAYHPPAGEWKTLKAGYLNERKLTPSELRKIYCLSHATLVFSEEEGACFTVAESLLCGTPILSNPPLGKSHTSALTLGGRELYLDSRNSRYLDSIDPKGVVNALDGLLRAKLDRTSIREQTLRLNSAQREVLARQVVQPLLEKFGESASAQELIFERPFSANGEGRHKLSCDGNLVPLTHVSRYLAMAGDYEKSVVGITNVSATQQDSLFTDEINQRIDRLWLRKRYLPNLRGNSILYCGVAGYTRHYPTLTELNVTTIDVDPNKKQYGSKYRHIIGDIRDINEVFDHVSFYGLLGHASSSIPLDINSVAQLHEGLCGAVAPGGSLLLGHQGLSWGKIISELSAVRNFRMIQDSVPGVTSNYIWWGVKPARVLIFVAHPDDCMLFAYPFVYQNSNFYFEICYLTGEATRLENCRYFWSAHNIPVRSLGFPDSPADLRNGASSIPDDEIHRALAAVVDEGTFDYILTHSSSGEYGHPHHVQAHRVASVIGKPLVTFSHHEKDKATIKVLIEAERDRVNTERLIDAHRVALTHFDKRFGVWSEGSYFSTQTFPCVAEPL